MRAARAAHVLDDDRLAERRLHVVGEQTRQRVDAAAGRSATTIVTGRDG